MTLARHAMVTRGAPRATVPERMSLRSVVLQCFVGWVACGCSALGAVAVIPSGDHPDASAALDSADAANVTADALDVLDASGDDGGLDAAVDGARDASADSGPEAGACIRVNPAFTGLDLRGIAASPDRFSFTTDVRVYYVTADGRLRVELRNAAMARRCAEDLGAPPGVTLVGTPAAAHRREHIIAAGRNALGALELWARFATDTAGPCGVTMSPWEQLPSPPAGDRFVTAPAARSVTDRGTDERVIVAAQTALNGLYYVDRPIDTRGPVSPWSAVATRPTANVCDAVRMRPVVQPLGGDHMVLRSLEQDPRGGFSRVSHWQRLADRLFTRTVREYFGAALPARPLSRHLHLLEAGIHPWVEIEVFTVGSAVWGWLSIGVAASGTPADYDPRSLGVPFAEFAGESPLVLTINGPGAAMWEGSQGDIYVFAQTPSAPARLRFAIARADEWFTSATPVVWQEAPDRLQ